MFLWPKIDYTPVCVYVYLYIYIYLHTCIHTHISIISRSKADATTWNIVVNQNRLYTCAYIYIYIYTYVHTYVHTSQKWIDQKPTPQLGILSSSKSIDWFWKSGWPIHKSALYTRIALLQVRSQNDLKVPRKLIDVTNISVSTENRISKSVYYMYVYIYIHIFTCIHIHTYIHAPIMRRSKANATTWTIVVTQNKLNTCVYIYILYIYTYIYTHTYNEKIKGRRHNLE